MPAVGQPSGPREPSVRTRAGLRRYLLAVTVLHDLDLEWDEAAADPDDGIPPLRVGRPDPVEVTADRLRAVLGDRDLEDPATVTHLARWLQLRRDLREVPAVLLADAVRVVGLPVGHARHPGADWTRVTVPGHALTLGPGLLPELLAEASGVAPTAAEAWAVPGGDAVPLLPPATTVPIPAGLLEDLGLDPAALWPAASARLEELGSLAAARRRRRPRDPLRPLAEADVVTLLGSRRLRFELADESGTGLAGVVVPMLNRGWVSNSSLDSAFGPAAAIATEPEQRGFDRPLLVTEYEVVQVPEGGHPLRYLGQSPRSRFS